MKKFSMRLMSLVLAGGLMLSVVACGTKTSQDEKNSTSENQVSTQEVTQAEPTAEPAKIVKIKMWEKPTSADTEVSKAFYTYLEQKLKEKFPNVEIQQDSVKPGADYRQEYDKSLMAGEAPTLMRLFSYTDIPGRILNGTIGDMTEYVNNWELKKKGVTWDKFDPFISSKDGKWYGIPYQAYIMGQIINRKLLTSLGGDPDNMPATWADFETFGKKYTNKSKPLFAHAMMGMDWVVWPYNVWLWSAGGQLIEDNGDGTVKCRFNETAGVDALEFWNQMIWKSQMTQKDILEDFSKLTDEVMSGRALTSWVNVNWFNMEALSKYGYKAEDFGMWPVPAKDATFKQATLTGGEVWTINPKATKDEMQAAWDIMTYISYDEEMSIATWELKNKHKVIDANPSMRTDLQDKKMSIMTNTPEQFKKDSKAQALFAQPEPAFAGYQDLKNVMVKPIQGILLKKGISREEIQKILNESAETLYSKYPNGFKK